MNAKQFLVSTLIGAVTLFVVGFLVFGLALANAYPATSIDREVPLLGSLFVAQIAWAALVTAVSGKWPGGASVGGGFKAAAVIGLLVSIAINLSFYSMTTLPVATITFVEPLIVALVFGIGGAAMGWSLGRASEA